MQEVNQLKQIANDVLKLSRQHGASSAEVNCGIEDGYTVTSRMGAVETIEYNRDKGVSVTVYFDKRKGSVTTSDTTMQSLNDSVKTACNIAKFTEEDPYSGLADAELMAKDMPDLDLYHEWNLTPEQAIELSLQCENYARSLDERIINSEGVSISTHKNFHIYGNTHGFIGAIPRTNHNITCIFLKTPINKFNCWNYNGVNRLIYN